MNKSFLAKAALVLLTLTVTAAVHAQVSPEEYEREQGRMEAAAYNQVIDMQKEVDTIVKKISDLQEEAGFNPKELKDDEDDSTNSSRGLVKALGEKLDMTDALKTEITEVTVEMQKQEGDEIFKSYDKAATILEKARKNLSDAKKLTLLKH